MDDVEIFIQSECPICGETGVNPAWQQDAHIFITACNACDGVAVVDTDSRTLAQFSWGMATSIMEFYSDFFAFVRVFFRRIFRYFHTR